MTISIVNRTEAEERNRHQEVPERLQQAYRDMRGNVESRHAEVMQIKQQLQDQVRDLDHVDKVTGAMHALAITHCGAISSFLEAASPSSASPLNQQDVS